VKNISTQKQTSLKDAHNYKLSVIHYPTAAEQLL